MLPSLQYTYKAVKQWVKMECSGAHNENLCLCALKISKFSGIFGLELAAPQ